MAFSSLASVEITLRGLDQILGARRVHRCTGGRIVVRAPGAYLRVSISPRSKPPHHAKTEESTGRGSHHRMWQRGFGALSGWQLLPRDQEIRIPNNLFVGFRCCGFDAIKNILASGGQVETNTIRAVIPRALLCHTVALFFFGRCADQPNGPATPSIGVFAELWERG